MPWIYFLSITSTLGKKGQTFGVAFPLAIGMIIINWGNIDFINIPPTAIYLTCFNCFLWLIWKVTAIDFRRRFQWLEFDKNQKYYGCGVNVQGPDCLWDFLQDNSCFNTFCATTITHCSQLEGFFLKLRSSYLLKSAETIQWFYWLILCSLHCQIFPIVFRNGKNERKLFSKMYSTFLIMSNYL